MRGLEHPAPGSSPTTWYLVAEDGDLVLRIHAGMRLGEDPAGELIVDPATGIIILDLDVEGGVQVTAASPEVELATPAGARVRSFEVFPGTRAEIALTHNKVILDTDFVSRPGTELLELKCVGVRASAPLSEPPAGDPATELRNKIRAAERHPPQHVRPVRRRYVKLAVAASILVGLCALPYWSHHMGYLTLPSAVFVAFRQAEPATGAGTREVNGAEGVYGETPVNEADRAASQAPAGDAEPGASRMHVGEVRPAARLAKRDTEFIVTPATRNVTGALPRQRPALAPVTVPDMTRGNAPAETPVASNREPSPQSAADSVASPGSTPWADVAPRIDLAAAAVDVPARVSPSTVFKVGSEASEAPSQATADLTIHQDLHAAALALREGKLTTPAGRSALDHYRRVMEADPDSVDAARGMRSVQEALLIRARTALGTDDLATAATAIEEVVRAGADAAIVTPLRGELAYRRNLLAAKLGRPGSLYPLSELEAASQVLPLYPLAAPARATGSVDLELTVTERGTVADVTVVSPAAGYFNAAARKAIRRWRFEPVLHDGRPVAVRTAVRITFRP